MKIKDLVFDLVDEKTYTLYRANGVKQKFEIEENKNVKPTKWLSYFKVFSSFEEAVNWANKINLRDFNEEIKKCQQMIEDWEVK